MAKPPTKYKAKPFLLPKALNQKQEDLIKSINSKDMTIVFGPAGTGKSYLPAALAAYYYYTGRIEQIVLTRPVVSVDRGLGFLPGTLEEKLQPWVLPVIEVLEAFLSPNEVACMLKNNKLIIAPLETIRGRTFKNSFILLDEAQNLTKREIIAFITRIGEHSKIVINGDIKQCDLKPSEFSGLAYIKYLLEDINNEKLAEKVGLIEFFIDDCVRSELCKLWLKAFDSD